MTVEERATEVVRRWFADGSGEGALVRQIAKGIAEDRKERDKPVARPFTEELWKVYCEAIGAPVTTDYVAFIRKGVLAVERRVREKCMEEIGKIFCSATSSGPGAYLSCQQAIKENMP